MAKEEKRGFINYLAILAIFVFSGAGSWENAAIEVMAEAWPNVDITLIRMESTLPFLVSMPVILLIGGIVGKKISYRTCINLGSACIAVGGAGPFFFAPSWTAVLVFRALLGVGVGLYSVRNAALIKSIPLEKQARYMGIGTALMNIGNAILQPLAGAFSARGWSWTFLANALVLITGVFIFFAFKEPDQELEESAAQDVKTDSHVKMDKSAWIFALMQFFATLSLYPLLSGMATFMNSRSLGSATLVGTVLSSYTIAGFVVSFLLADIHRLFKRFTAPLMYGLVVLGQLLVLFAPNIGFVFVGTILCGVGFMANWSLFYIYVGQKVHPDKLGFAQSLILTFNQAAVFLSTYFIVMCHTVFGRATDAESAYIGAVIVFAAMSVYLLFGKLVPKDAGREQSAA